MRKITSLNFNWKFIAKYDIKMLENNYDDSDFNIVNIPHTVKELPLNDFDESSYQFISCYRKKHMFTKEDLNNCQILKFYGVSNATEVYINGKFAYSHLGGYNAFSFDIHDFLVVGENQIVVKVDSTEREDVPPFGYVVDYLTYGGIYREVELISVPNEHLTNLRIVSNNPLLKNKPFDCIIDFENNNNKKLTAKLEVFFDDEIVFSCENVTSTNNMVLNGIIENGFLWDIDNPNLYEFKVTLLEGKNELDYVTEKFGFRSAEFTPYGFLLNEKKLKIRGLNRHQAYPYVGYAMPKSMQIEDARFLKEDLCVNMVRTSHYPQSQHFINACDELGLLVFTEAPGWQHIGDEKFKENYKKMVSEMILQNINHPSIVLWGIRINESPDDDQLYIETNKIAKQLDSTRQTGGVRAFKGSHLFEDVYTYNDFNYDGKSKPLCSPISVTKSSVPYLVTEHNGHMFPTKRFDSASRKLEHALRHAEVLNKAYSSNEYCGAIGWCMSDYNTHMDFGSGDRICYHGVSDMFRIPKLAAAVYASQSKNEPYLEISSEMAFGDYDRNTLGKFYAFTNCDAVKVYKNDKYINTFYSNNQNLSNLPHPVIEITDLIGKLIEQDGKYIGKDAKRIRKCLSYIANYGLNRIPFYIAIPFFFTLKKHHISLDEAYNEFGKYLTTWGEKNSIFTFIGLINNKEVCKINKSIPRKMNLNIEPTNTHLTHGETYDVALVRITAISEENNILPYAMHGLHLSTTGNIELIGSPYQSLIGGAIGVYIKTTDKGYGSLQIQSELGNKSVDFIIE